MKGRDPEGHEGEAKRPTPEYAGVNTIAIHCRSIGRKHVVEVIEFDEKRRAIRGSACHGADA